jgi:protein TonB
MRNRPLCCAILALLPLFAQPAALLGQDNSAKGTYQGEPLCENRRDVHPRPTFQPEPDYDEKDRKKKIQGTVLLSVVVTKEGQTADIKVQRSLTPGLDEQAIKAVTRWKFDPAMQGGQPCPIRIVVEVTFHLY